MLAPGKEETSSGLLISRLFCPVLTAPSWYLYLSAPHSCPVLVVYSGCPSVLFWLSALAVLSRLSWLDSVSCPDSLSCPLPSWQSDPECLVLAVIPVLSWLSCLRLSDPDLFSWLSSPGCPCSPFLVFLSWRLLLSFTGCPVFPMKFRVQSVRYSVITRVSRSWQKLAGN